MIDQEKINDYAGGPVGWKKLLGEASWGFLPEYSDDEENSRKGSRMELPEALGQWANYFLVWIGYGALVGLLAKALMPGKDPGGALATVLMGVLGSVMGAGILGFFSEDLHVSPLSLLGFVVATIGAFVLLGLVRLTMGRSSLRGPRWHRPRRRVSVVEEE